MAETLATKEPNVYANLATAGLDSLGYVKRLEDGSVAYVEEKRTGRKKLSAVTMRKYPAMADVDRIAANLHPNVRNDSGDTAKIVIPGPMADKKVLYQSGIQIDGQDGTKNEESAANDGRTGVTDRAESAPPADQVADKEILPQSDVEMQPCGWLRVPPDGSYEIGKTKIGDLSTFVHEPAHAHLKIIGDQRS